MIEPKFISFLQWLDIWKSDLEEYPCEECDGEGTKNIVCPNCAGTRTVECNECGYEHECEDCDNGYINVQCEDCDGNGKLAYHKQYELAKKQDRIKWQEYSL